jgi:uncharacterized RDD family membrane protein YckC
MTESNGQLDTHIEIITPENIAFHYRVAGPFRRLPAFLIDLVIRLTLAAGGLLATSVFFGATGLKELGYGLTLLLWFFLAWFYGGLFETFWNGQTPGKRLMNIRVVSIEGQPITPLQAILRNILREVDAQPMWLYQVGLLAATSNQRFQRLGDLACGTMVVVEERRHLQEVIRTGEPEAMRVASLIPPSFQPNRSLARALAAYVQRRRLFPWGRRMEIARHLGEPLRLKFQLPVNTDLDLLLCGLYHRTFIADRGESFGDSPFSASAAPIALSVPNPSDQDKAQAPSEPFPMTSATVDQGPAAENSSLPPHLSSPTPDQADADESH